MTATEITARTTRKEAALVAAARAAEGVVAAKADLETLKHHYAAAGLDGSNDKQRAADLFAKTGAEREALAEAEKALREAQLELDIAALRVQEALILSRLKVGDGLP